MKMKLPAHIKGLVFDCDGTLADTMPLHWHAWQIVTQRHGLFFPEDRFYSFGGVPSRDILKQLAQEQGRSLDHIAVAHEKEEMYLPLISRAEPVHAVVTNEMVKNQKPAPDIFLEAAKRIGVEPKFCRAYEDTELGLTAIRAAGMEAVDVRDLIERR